MDGILVVDKPGGMTSHDVISRVRRITGQKRVGHAGTLDPAATGVLLVLLGRATKLSPLFTESDKSYEGVIVFGAETDTADADGKVIRERDAYALTEKALREAVKRFIGTILQVPPAYSAVKIGGRPMYKLAREGKAQPEIEARRVTIYDFDVTSFTPGPKAEAGFRVSCSKGTYIRSLATDLGEELGVGGYLKELRRTSSGAFGLADAVSLDGLTLTEIESASKRMADGLSGIPSAVVDDAEAARIMNGFGLSETAFTAETGAPVAILDRDGLVLAIHEITQSGGTKPVRVIGEGRL